ncbi:MAG: four helix bundle protein [Fibrobacter sp.]|uniref:four helix bundle protein n=1 Tax=Fibrobacter sp. TaxID=35828 RepID=UPI0025C1BD2B|nr:four helix bundle protein [Fibrobacter sp.]MBQ3715784.1 four helix bundle protein [Fibrobacter sp.]MBQ7078148.1 four helix bundle protein [Fibrobacter sp.]
MHSYKDLIVWKKSVKLVMQVYDYIQAFPKNESYVLSDQMRRAVVSIPSNIAEGYERMTTAEYIRFLSIARGSKAELETQLHICNQLKLGNMEKNVVLQSSCEEIGKMLNSMVYTLNSKKQHKSQSPRS